MVRVMRKWHVNGSKNYVLAYVSNEIHIASSRIEKLCEIILRVK